MAKAGETTDESFLNMDANKSQYKVGETVWVTLATGNKQGRIMEIIENYFKSGAEAYRVHGAGFVTILSAHAIEQATLRQAGQGDLFGMGGEG